MIVHLKNGSKIIVCGDSKRFKSSFEHFNKWAAKEIGKAEDRFKIKAIESLGYVVDEAIKRELLPADYKGVSK